MSDDWREFWPTQEEIDATGNDPETWASLDKENRTQAEEEEG
jgi:hypothetical protein